MDPANAAHIYAESSSFTTVGHRCKSQTYVRYYSAAAETYFAILLVTSPELDKLTTDYDRLLKSIPRSNFTRPHLLLEVAALRTQRNTLSGQKSDLDKAITHYTEAILLSPNPSGRIVLALLHLAMVLISRYSLYDQPSGLKSSIKYLRFLRINFRSPQDFDNQQTSEDFSSLLFCALAFNLKFTSGDMAQDLEEMATLIPEFITTDHILTFNRMIAIRAFGEVVTALSTEMYRQEGTQRWAFDQIIQVLREAAVLNPDLLISYALAVCLSVRFEMTHAMNDCKEAISNFDRCLPHAPLEII